MSEWLAPTVCVLLFAAFSYAVGYLSFCKGVEMGKQLPQQMVSRIGRMAQITVARDPVLDPLRKCEECGCTPHHKDCPLDPAKNKPKTGRTWKGFSRIKRDLESKET